MPVCPGGPDCRPCGPGGGAPGNRKGDRKRWGGWRPTPQGAALQVGVGTHGHTHTRARPNTCSHARGLAHRRSRTACGLRAPSAGSCWCWLPPSSQPCVDPSHGGPVVWPSRLCWGRTPRPSPHTRQGGGEVPAHPQSPEETPRWAARVGLGYGAGVDPTQGSWGSPVTRGCTKPPFLRMFRGALQLTLRHRRPGPRPRSPREPW